MNNTRYPYSPIVRPGAAPLAEWRARGGVGHPEHRALPYRQAGNRAPSGQRPAGARRLQFCLARLRPAGRHLANHVPSSEKYGVRGTVALNAEVCEHYPAVVEEGLKRGWEYMGHGTDELHQGIVLSPPRSEEREVIGRHHSRSITGGDRQRPRGWFGSRPRPRRPARPISWPRQGVPVRGRLVTPTISPSPLLSKAGSSVSQMPYSNELNDIPLVPCPPTWSGPARSMKTIRDQFDVLYQDGETTARVMGAQRCIPFITGVPGPQEFARPGARLHYGPPPRLARDRRRDPRRVPGHHRRSALAAGQQGARADRSREARGVACPRTARGSPRGRLRRRSRYTAARSSPARRRPFRR